MDASDMWWAISVLAMLVGLLVVLGTVSAVRDWLSYAVRRGSKDRG